MPRSAFLESLNPDDFFHPLEGENPCGLDLQASDEGRKIRGALRDLRNEARKIERQADEGSTRYQSWAAAVPFWKKLRDDGIEVLKTKSRDLHVLSLCIEALARTDGFEGLHVGFSMAQGFVETFWDHLYPAPDPEELPCTPEKIAEIRILPLERLVGVDSDGLLAPAIYHLPLVEPRGGEKYGLSHWRSSQQLGGITDRKKLEEAIASGGTSPAAFSTAVHDTPIETLTAIYSEIVDVRAAWGALASAVSEVSAGRASILVGPLDGLFDDCLRAIAVFAPSAVTIPAEPTDTAASAEAGAEATDDKSNAPAAAVTAKEMPATREEAFLRLERIADFFDRHDPQSLISAHIRHVVRLGRMSREDYFDALIEDKNALNNLFKTVGIPRS